MYLLTQYVHTGNLIVICPGPHIVNNIDTTQIQHLPVNTLTPARGFFAPRNRFPDLSTTQSESTTLHPTQTPNTTSTDREQGATDQANSA